MPNNYRVICISTVDGSLYDIAEFIRLVDAINWKNSGRLVGNLHTFIVDISSLDPSMHYICTRCE